MSLSSRTVFFFNRCRNKNVIQFHFHDFSPFSSSIFFVLFFIVIIMAIVIFHKMATSATLDGVEIINFLRGSRRVRDEQIDILTE